MKYKTVPCKKYWTVGHCELGPRCVYIHQVSVIPITCNAQITSQFHVQEVSDAMAKQIVANNGELPPTATLSVPIKKSNPGVDGDVLRCGMYTIIELHVFFSVEPRLAVDMPVSVTPQPPSRPGELDQGSEPGEQEQSTMG